VGGGSAAGDDACGRIFAAERGARVRRRPPATPGELCFGCADAGASARTSAPSGGGRPTQAAPRKARAPILTISIRPR